MKNKKGNVTAIAIIIVIVITTTAVITWLVAAKTQVSVQQMITQLTAPAQPITLENQLSVQSTPTSNDTGWKLISGVIGDSCSGVVYDGRVTVKGWYVMDTDYVEKEWMLKIADSDMNKFPEAFFGGVKDAAHNANQKLKLVDAPHELQKELRESTKENPKQITLKGYYLYCEGFPVVSIFPATESFKQYIKK